MSSLLSRITFYLSVTAITFAGCYVPYVSVFALFLPVALIFLAAAFLLVYLPLLDWPLLVWRKTGQPVLVLVTVAAALVPAVVVPLQLNVDIKNRAGRYENGYTIPVMTPSSPIVAGSVLFVEQYGGVYAAACGVYCRALLWSGVSDHVLATNRLEGDRLESAQLFTLQRMSVCPGPEFGRERPRDGLCLVRREISNPYFDAILKVDGPYFDRRLTLFADQGGPMAQTYWVTAYDCRKLCSKVLSLYAVEAQRLAFPVYPVFAFGLDSGGPFGLRYASRPFSLHSPSEVLKTAFGIELGTLQNPQPGFTGDVALGGPLLPTAQYFRELHQREESARIEAENAYYADMRARIKIDHDAIGKKYCRVLKPGSQRKGLSDCDWIPIPGR